MVGKCRHAVENLMGRSLLSFSQLTGGIPVHQPQQSSIYRLDQLGRNAAWILSFFQHFSQDWRLVGTRNHKNDKRRLIYGCGRQGKPVQPFFCNGDFVHPVVLFFQN
jgi:hypothetical protein